MTHRSIKKNSLQNILLLLGLALINGPGLQAQPLNLGEKINSPYDELNPIISSDGNHLFFVRRNHPQNKFGVNNSEDIWYSELIDPNTWSEAQRVPNINIARYNSILAISPDDQRVLLNGVFNKAGTRWIKRGLSVAIREGESWSKPKELPIDGISSMNKGLHTTGAINNEENQIILSFSEDYMSKVNDLYLIEKGKKGRWKKPKKLNSLCTSNSEDAPFITEDGQHLYFSSDRNHPDTFDIYRSTRLSEDSYQWSKPQIVDLPINTTGWESYLKIDNVYNWAYFSSTHFTTLGGADLYRIPLKSEHHGTALKSQDQGTALKSQDQGTALKSQDQGTALKNQDQYSTSEVQQPQYSTLEVQLFDKDSNQPLLGREFRVLINGVQTDSIVIWPQKAMFQKKLLPNKSYEITVQMPGFNLLTHSIEVEEKNQRHDFLLQSKSNPNQEKTELTAAHSEDSTKQDPQKTLLLADQKDDQNINEINNTTTTAPSDTVNTMASDQSAQMSTTSPLENIKSPFSHILFYYNQASVTPQSEPHLQAISNELKKEKLEQINIEGHTSSEGNRNYNYALSKKRSETIKNYLIDKGIDPSRLHVIAHGPDYPVASNDTENGRKKNRRVEIKIHSANKNID